MIGSQSTLQFKSYIKHMSNVIVLNLYAYRFDDLTFNFCTFVHKW